jgi:hypothetical protein
MPNSVKATRTTVQIGDFAVDGFMLPDGSYRMSQTQAAQCVDRPEINARRFLDSKAIKALLGNGYTPDTIEIESSDTQVRGQSRFNALPLQVVTAYWFNQATQGNKQALSLIWALLTESLERRFDEAFGVTRTEEERNQRLSERLVEQLETDLKTAFDFEAATRAENEYLMSVLRQHGIDPWALPSDELDDSASLP